MCAPQQRLGGREDRVLESGVGIRGLGLGARSWWLRVGGQELGVSVKRFGFGD